MNKKVSIITLHYIKNYGSVLQTYATQTVFERLSCDAEFVDYIRPNECVVEQKKSIKEKVTDATKSVILGLVKGESFDKEDHIFKNFVEKYIHLSKYYDSYQELCANPPQADVYCTGSDQMWNCEWNGGIIPAYYLEFAPEGKRRISYAASIGMQQIPQQYKEQVQEMTAKYAAISVRENSAVEVLKTIDYPDAMQVLDPTFMLGASDWEKIMAPRPVSYDYVLIYQLNPNEEFDQFARDLAKEKGIKTLRIAFSLKEAMMADKTIYFPTVTQWLSLFYYASYVVTDSFHGTAFSINLQKQLSVFYPPRFKTRLDSILSLTGLEDCIAEGKHPRELKEITTYDKVQEILDRERAKAVGFLKKALDS